MISISEILTKNWIKTVGVIIVILINISCDEERNIYEISPSFICYDKDTVIGPTGNPVERVKCLAVITERFVEPEGLLKISMNFGDYTPRIKYLDSFDLKLSFTGSDGRKVILVPSSESKVFIVPDMYRASHGEQDMQVTNKNIGAQINWKFVGPVDWDEKDSKSFNPDSSSIQVGCKLLCEFKTDEYPNYLYLNLRIIWKDKMREVSSTLTKREFVPSPRKVIEMDFFTGIFGIALGLGSIWFSIKFLKLYFKVKGWSRVEAKVISKEITIHKKYSTTRTPYKLNASYTYIFSGSEYPGTNIYLAELMGGQANHMKGDAEKRLERIQGAMTVYVDPNDPRSSVMYCEGVGLYYFILAMGVFALLFGITKLV